MAANTYPVGDVVRLSTSFTVSNVATDPTTVTLYVKGPTITLNTYTYAGATVIKDSVGNYHYDFTIPASGQFYYRFEGTGTVVAAAENTFQAGPSWFK